MDEYPSNSNKSREEVAAKAPDEKKIEKVVTGNVKLRKRGVARTFSDVFLTQDVDSVKHYILMDVIIPKVKDVLHDIGSEAWDSIWGIQGKSHGSTPASKVSYRDYYDKKRDRREPSRYSGGSYRDYQRVPINDIVLDSRGEAEDVIERMDDIIATYGTVSVADLYELCGVSCNYTDNRYGWTDISMASVVRVREGFLIKMPRPMPLD